MQLDNYEIEVILMEECGELVQAISKVIRTQGRGQMVLDMTQELADVSLLMNLLQDKYNIEDADISRRMRDKRHKLEEMEWHI